MSAPLTATVRMHRNLTIIGRACVFGLLMTPLIYNPFAYLYGDAFFPPKWCWIGAMTAVGLAAMFCRALIGVPLRLPFDQTWIAALAFFLINAASISWAESRSLAVERTLQIGGVTLALWFGFQSVRTRKVMMWLAWGAVGVGVVTALWTLRQDFAAAFWPEQAGMVPNLPDWRGYLAAGLGNTNHIGDLLALDLLVALVLFGEARRRNALLAAGAALVVIAAGLTVCWSVGSNLGLFTGAAIFLLLLAARGKTRFFRFGKRWIALAACWALMLGFFMTDQPLNPHRPGLWNQAFGSERWHEGGSTRLVIWAGGLEIVRTHPWLGVGAGNFTYAYPAMRSGLLEGRPELQQYEGNWTNAAHNGLLQAWSELGAAGMLALVLMVALAFHSLLKDIRWSRRREFIVRASLASLLGAICAQSMMNFVLQHPTGLISFYTILLAVIAEKNMRRHAAAMPPLVVEKGWALLTLDWKSMERAMGVGLAFRPPRWVALSGGILAWACVAVVFALLTRPVLAEREYGLSSTFRMRGDPIQEEAHILKALRLNPWSTGCRSRYVEFLLEEKRPAEALVQLKKVRTRLSSRELWQREARALDALGRHSEAELAYRHYLDSLPGGMAPVPMNSAI